MLVRLVGRVTMVAAVLLAATADRVGADPPAPTDYRSEVIAIEPDTGRVTAAVVGGDSFIELRALDGARIEVPGYQQEPYLRFDADGRVFENRDSPTYFLNRSRFGDPIPPGITADTPPRWVQVADDATFAWHDHRTHWMSPEPPRNAAPGDTIIDNVIAITVDGEPVAIRVTSTWQESPSLVPALVGALAGMALVAGMLRRRGPATMLANAALASALALVSGVIQFTSVPSSTGPSVATWLFPATAGAAVTVAAVAWRRIGWAAGHLLIVLAAVQLLLWTWQRRGWITRAVLPTDLSWPLDRALTAGVAVVSMSLVVLAGLPVVRAVIGPTARPAVPADR